MSSFYGGKQGRTFNLVKSYKTLSEMVEAFSISTYSEVLFGEYVIIETSDRSQPQNGCLYRRGLNTSDPINTSSVTNPGAGAIYVGKISGPMGPTPDVNFTVLSSSTISDIAYQHLPASTDQYGNITSANAQITFPYLKITPTVSTAVSTATAEATVSTVSGEPFSSNISFSLPITQRNTEFSDFTFNKNTGEITVVETPYDISNTSQASSTVSVGVLEYPKALALSSEGALTATYATTGTEEVATLGTIVYPKTLTSTNDSEIIVTYNDNSTTSIPQAGSQFHVLGNYATTEALYTAYPNGIPSTSSHTGWVVTVGTGELKTFYGYDYINNSGWYAIGGFGQDQVDAVIDPTKITAFSPAAEEPNNLKLGGTWFVTEE